MAMISGCSGRETVRMAVLEASPGSPTPGHLEQCSSAPAGRTIHSAGRPRPCQSISPEMRTSRLLGSKSENFGLLEPVLRRSGSAAVEGLDRAVLGLDQDGLGHPDEQ